jgi:biotin transport system substrate-specific component
MLRTFPAPASLAERTWRIAGILAFTLLVAISAKIKIEIGPVPFTMQPLVVLLAGMVLGWRDGMLSLMTYVLLIAAGMPLDARSVGTAALFGPTGGYLIGFVAAAGATGFLVERAGERLWQRWLAGLVGVAVIYLFGVSHLALYLGRDFGVAWETGAMPFLIPDSIKALLAAGLTETLRFSMNNQTQQKTKN